MMLSSRVVICGLLLTLLIVEFAGIASPRARFLSTLMQALEPRPYSTKDIALTAPYMKTFHPRVLVFNGTNFEVYNLDHKNTFYMKESWHCGRCGQIIPLMVHALKAVNPGRFEPGQPVFQLLFSAGDSISSDCVNPGTCPVQDFAPISLFGSAPTSESEIPTVKAFPNWFYLKCIYEYKLNGAEQCKWAEPFDEHPLPWNELKPTVIWRGSDFTFLPGHKEFKFKGAASIDLTNVATKKDVTRKLLDHWNELNPRWRGAALTAKAELDGDHWIDTKFTGPFEKQNHERFLDRDVHISTTKKMRPKEMAEYKYQIDYGGGGGTSWRGTMTKLGFPGVLLHHQTPSKDWFFDDMKPWIHYIPVNWHLSDLHEKYKWAESHQVEAKRISDTATTLFQTFMEATYMERIYKELFVDHLRKVVEAYVSSPSESWSDIQAQYAGDGFEMRLVSHCDDAKCHTFYSDGIGVDSQRFGTKVAESA